MKAGPSKAVTCNYHQHIPAALQMLNPFSLGQHLLTTEVWEEVTSCFIAAVLLISTSKRLTISFNKVNMSFKVYLLSA